MNVVIMNVVFVNLGFVNVVFVNVAFMNTVFLNQYRWPRGRNCTLSQPVRTSKQPSPCLSTILRMAPIVCITLGMYLPARFYERPTCADATRV